MASVQDDVLDIIIIGGGWSGLLLCKHAKDEGLTAQVLEKRDGIGGVWNFSDDPNITTVMQTTRTSSSSTVTEMSDFPMPEEIGEFPKHDDVLEYLKSYSEHFGLGKHIRFNCGVQNAEKIGALWNVQTEHGDVCIARQLAVCTGIHQKPDLSIKDTLLKDFSGTVHHSGEFKMFCSEHKGKTVMILGGGETASDILEQWYPYCGKIVWCIPRGQHFFRKYAKLLPHRRPQALDKASSRAMKLIAPFSKSKPGLAWVCKWTTNGSLLAYQGHGIPEFRNNANFFHSFINKHAHVLDLVDYEKVIPKAGIERIEDKTVYFQDGTNAEVDVIISCSGYLAEFPFLSPTLRNVPPHMNYKFVFNTTDPTLAFLGYIRPVVGSIPGLTEMQARWVARVWSKRVNMVGEVERKQAVIKDNEFWSGYFKGTSMRLKTLVEGYIYLDDLAKLNDVYPDYYALLKRNPRGFLTAYFAPYNGCSYLLNDPKHEQNALRTLKRHSKASLSPSHLLLLLFLRLIWFDWVLDKLSVLKYHIQTSRWWRAIREYRVVKFANYVWTVPKRLLFDKGTRA